MNAQHIRILRIIADLEAEGAGCEVDEFRVAQECGAVPETLPRHNWVNHPCRGDLIRTLTYLDQTKLIYATRCGYWGLHLTQRGRAVCQSTREATEAPDNLITWPVPAQPRVPEVPVWEAPRPSAVAYTPRHDYFYNTVALAVIALGALMIFAFGQSSLSPFARHIAEAAAAPTATMVRSLPALPTATPTPPSVATSTPSPLRAFVVANTGGDGVYLRRTPQAGDKLAAWPDNTRLDEIGPEQTISGVVWRQVRAPDGTAGFVPAQYTAVAP